MAVTDQRRAGRYFKLVLEILEKKRARRKPLKIFNSMISSSVVTEAPYVPG